MTIRDDGDNIRVVLDFLLCHSHRGGRVHLRYFVRGLSSSQPILEESVIVTRLTELLGLPCRRLGAGYRDFSPSPAGIPKGMSPLPRNSGFPTRDSFSLVPVSHMEFSHSFRYSPLYGSIPFLQGS